MALRNDVRRLEKSYGSARWSRSYKALQASDPSPIISSVKSWQTNYEGCASWVKYAIYGCNIVFLVVGVTTLTVGAWLRTDSRFREFLSERYRNVVEEAFWQAPTLYMFSYITIILGACMIVVSMLGCCGAITQSRPLLIIYAVVTSFLMLGVLAAGIYVIYKRDGIDIEVSDALTYMVQHYYQGAGIVQESLDRLQQTFRCCGNAGCSDFKVFRQDVPRTCDIRCDGCHYRIMLALRIGFSVGFIVFLVVVLLQLLVIGLSLVEVFRHRDKLMHWANKSWNFEDPDSEHRYYSGLKSRKMPTQSRNNVYDVERSNPRRYGRYPNAGQRY